MPQPTQNSLVHVLLMWTVILTIIQGVFIAVFFTRGQPEQNSRVTAAEITVPPGGDATHSPPPSDDTFQLGKMLFYKFTEVDGKVEWQARTRGDTTIIPEGKDLSIRKTGYYFITLRLTLDSKCMCNGTLREACTVELSDETRVLMQGWVDAKSCSTGLLGTVAVLSAGSKLQFSINMTLGQIDQEESRTHLAVIMLSQRVKCQEVGVMFRDLTTSKSLPYSPP